MEKASAAGLTFHDLRGTAVTRLAISGCTPAEIATITGHSLGDVATILDRHYLSRDMKLDRQARTEEIGNADCKTPCKTTKAFSRWGALTH